MTTQAMLDIETMGNHSDSAIIAIGAVSFNEKGVITEFYQEINLQSSIDAGGNVDGSTIMWWLKQSEKARGAFVHNDKAANVSVALKLFEEWINRNNINEVWGNGAQFDNTILGNTYRRLGMQIPWKFWNDRCYRTIKNLHPEIELVRQGTHHNAVDDAKTQALHLIKILNK